MKVKVNKEKCIGCGYCFNSYDNIFTQDDDGKAKVIVSEVPEDSTEEAQDAINCCPGEAISKE